MKKLLIIIGVTIGLNTSIIAGPIHDAAQNGEIDEIKSLINIGVSVDHKDNNGATALHVSVRRSNFEVADFLISVGANVNAEDDFGRTPLMSAREVRVASLLINNGAEVGIKDLDGDTAIHRLAEWAGKSTSPVLKLLIASGADVNETNILGRTPMDIAIDEGEDSDDLFFQQLQQAGAKTGLQLLGEKVAQLSTGTTNPTDEWPRKMWEIDFFHDEDRIPYPTSIGYDGASILLGAFYWVSRDGELFEIPNPENHNSSNFLKYIRYFDSVNFVISNKAGDTVTMYSRIGGEVVQKEFKGTFRFPSTSGKGIPQSSHIGISKDGGTGNLICWDFRPPAIFNIADDEENGGGDETANSRLIIKTAGRDIALATDGKLGAAELQKSNDLRSWRKLSDVPKEALKCW